MELVLSITFSITDEGSIKGKNPSNKKFLTQRTELRKLVFYADNISYVTWMYLEKFKNRENVWLKDPEPTIFSLVPRLQIWISLIQNSNIWNAPKC